MINDFEMGEILQSKFFHDMAGCVGAINNGVEFLSENRSDVQKKAAELMKVSANEAVTRMNYYRQAYGYVNLNLEANFERSIKTVNDYFHKNKIKINWNGNSNNSTTKVNNKVTKLLFNIIYITASTMIYGGEIHVNYKVNSNNRFYLEITGTSAAGIKLDRDIIAIIVENNQLAINSKNVHLFYFKRFCEINNISYSCEIGEKIKFVTELDLDITSPFNTSHIQTTEL